MLTPFDQNIYFADGPAVSFHGFPYPTRMVVVRLSSSETWVWSPIELTEDLAVAVDAVGPVAHIVSPNKLHHLALSALKPERLLIAHGECVGSDATHVIAEALRWI
ncbi:MAG: hypothetical protein KGQ57_10405 [Burkholderiales bacterium]|nr:hypothetical protein [Burkholderiales bacterium]